jgi:RHS repeat-associated protein
VTTRYYYDGQNVIAEYDQTDQAQRSYVHGQLYVDERAVLYDHSDPSVKPPGKKYQDRYYLLAELYTAAGLADCRGWMEEMYVHDTYGQVTMWDWPLGDVNRDGNTNSIDMAMVYSLVGQANPWGDANLGGSVTSGDMALVQSWNGTLKRQVNYSEAGNPYHFTGRTTDTLHASALLVSEDANVKRLQDNRNRMYDPKHGRWLQRDPIGVRPGSPAVGVNARLQYRDGASLYQYVRSQPTVKQDPTGLRDNYIVLWWPTIGHEFVNCAEPDPPAPGQPSKACDPRTEIVPSKPADFARCDPPLQEALQDEEVKNLLSRISRTSRCRGKQPRAWCRCCIGNCKGAGAWHVGFAVPPGAVYICDDQEFNKAKMKKYLLHEFTHELNDCLGMPDKHCEDRLKNEMLAYLSDDGPPPYSDDVCRRAFESAVWSSCYAKKCSGTDIIRVALDVRQWCLDLTRAPTN